MCAGHPNLTLLVFWLCSLLRPSFPHAEAPSSLYSNHSFKSSRKALLGSNAHFETCHYGWEDDHAVLWLVRPVLLICLLEHMDREWCSVPQKEKWILDGHVTPVWRKCQLLSHVILFASPWTIAHQIPLSMGFPRQECWSGLPLPSLEDLPDPQIEPGSLAFRQILYHLSYDRMDWKMCPGIIIWQSL